MTTTSKEILDTYSHVVGEQWAAVLDEEFKAQYMQTLKTKLEACYIFGKVYPERKHIFRAYRETPLNDVRVLILGQDPYHNGVATGLAFDVGSSPTINPSLRNIQKEIRDSVGLSKEGGDLSHWTKQGVMLLNTILTVDANSPKSHHGYGWEKFVAATLNALNFRECVHPLVVMLWGKEAQKFEHFFTMPEHLVLKAPHPAAEAYAGGKAGYFGCGHFKKANDWLQRHSCPPINW